MRILVFSWRDLRHPSAGGAEYVMHEHMKGWVEAGHGVTHFSSYLKGKPREEEIDGVRIVRRGYQYLGVQAAAFLYYLKNRKSCDFLVDEFHGIPFFTPLFSRKPKLAVIHETARGVWLMYPLPFRLNFFVGIIGYLFEPLVFLFYRKTFFMTVSNSTKKSLCLMGIPQKNITIIYNAIDLEVSKYKKYSKESENIVCYLGALSKDKGVEDAVECFFYLKKKGIENFWVIGKAVTKEYEQKIRNLVKKYNLDNNIKFWGYVDDDKKYELLRRCHVLINPSVREGWGLVNIEANAMGTPVVAYRSPGLIDSITDNSGVLVDKNTPSALAQAVFELFQDRKKYEMLCRGAKEWSKKFNWKKSRSQSLKLIEGIYDKRISRL